MLPRQLDLADLRNETIAKSPLLNICHAPHPRVQHIYCDLLSQHEGDHENCDSRGTILAWLQTKKEQDVKVFEWAAGLNHNPYKRRRG